MPTEAGRSGMAGTCVFEEGGAHAVIRAAALVLEAVPRRSLRRVPTRYRKPREVAGGAPAIFFGPPSLHVEKAERWEEEATVQAFAGAPVAKVADSHGSR